MEPKVELKLMKEIDHITEMFDFEKVHKVMKFLNWRWYFIKENFDEEKLFKEIEKLQVKCPKCNEAYEGLFTFDDFLTF